MDTGYLFRLLLPHLKGYLESGQLDEVALFTGSASDTVRDWVSEKQPARGRRLIRLWHFLEAVGCEIPELRENLPAFSRYVGVLFSFDVISFNEVEQIVGVKNEQTALQIMRGQKALRPAMNLEELRELYDEALVAAQASLKAKLGSNGPLAAAVVPSPLQEEEEVPPEGLAGVTQRTSSTVLLATLLSAAMPLVRHVVSDESTPEDRDDLRRLMGAEGVFELANHLNALCSERARNQGR